MGGDSDSDSDGQSVTLELVPSPLATPTGGAGGRPRPSAPDSVTIEPIDGAPAAGIHFLTDDDAPPPASDTPLAKAKSELLEYILQADGTVLCKLCGQTVASRTTWYRHKYKYHVVASASGHGGHITPTPLFKCTRCNIFFKSRRGFTGHVAARHSEEAAMPADEAASRDASSTAAVAAAASALEEVQQEAARSRRREAARGADWERQREQEEKLVREIIDRVRRECEAQGAAIGRRGYSRRSTVMNTCN